MKHDLKKSLEALEQDYWGEPDFDTSLVHRCHRLRTIPMRELSPGDLRVLIGQNISLQHLVPLALDVLEQSPLIDAELYGGDLLVAMLRADPRFWKVHPPFRRRLLEIAERAFSCLETPCDSLLSVDGELIRSSFARFRDATA